MQTTKGMLWTGRILSAIPVIMLTMSAMMKFAKPPAVLEGLAKFGFPLSLVTPLGVLELLCCMIYVVPKTSVFGAILLTGYLGGAIATHVRIGDSSYPTVVVLALLVWAGLALRDGALRTALLRS